MGPNDTPAPTAAEIKRSTDSANKAYKDSVAKVEEVNRRSEGRK